jgi:hypothetical protein
MVKDGITKVMAISTDTLENPTDFFLPGSEDLKNIGTLEIEGTATNYLNEAFEL